MDSMSTASIIRALKQQDAADAAAATAATADDASEQVAEYEPELEAMALLPNSHPQPSTHLAIEHQQEAVPVGETEGEQSGGGGADYVIKVVPVQIVHEEPNEDELEHALARNQVDACIVSRKHVTTARTLSVFGGPSNLMPDEFARAVLGASYRQPFGVHCAHYVSFSLKLTQDASTWTPHRFAGKGADPMMLALSRAYPYQPSVDSRFHGKDYAPVFLARPPSAEDTAFKTENTLVLCACVERVRHVRGDCAVGISVGMSTESRTSSESEVPQTQMRRLAVGARDSSGNSFSVIAYPKEPLAREYDPPKRLGAPFCNEWTSTSSRTRLENEGNQCWTDFTADNDRNFSFLSKPPTRATPDEHVLGQPVANSLPTFQVKTRTAQNTPYTVHCMSADALRQAYMRLKIYEREALLSGKQKAVDLVTRVKTECGGKVPVWIVLPRDGKDWSNATTLPRAGAEEALGVRTLTWEEEAVIDLMRVVVQEHEPAYNLLLSNVPAGRRQTRREGRFQEVVVGFKDYVMHVNEAIAADVSDYETRQLRDASRVCVSAAPFTEKAPFEVEITVGFIVAPLELSPLPTFTNTNPDDEDRALQAELDAHPEVEGFFQDARLATTSAGALVPLLQLSQRSYFIKTAAWRRMWGDLDVA